MITDDFCSFEVAKLLKEKGFDESTSMVYMSYGDLCKLNRYDSIRNSNYNDITKNYFEYTAPTHQMAMKWLREMHNIFIVIEPHIYDYINEKNSSYVITLWQGDNYYENVTSKDYLTYEEAVEAALKYSLENLI